MGSSPVCNALLRVDDISGDAPVPFERPRHDSAFWVLALSDQHLSVVDWCARTTQILIGQIDRLPQAHLAGGQSSLFVEAAAGKSVLRLEANVLGVLGKLGISLECAHAIET